MSKVGTSSPSWRALGVVFVVLFSMTVAGSQPTLPVITDQKNLPSRDTPLGYLASPTSDYFDCQTSSIRICVLYDVTTGAEVYADSWRYLLASYGYSLSVLSLQQVLADVGLLGDQDLILVDHSCGAAYGEETNLNEAMTLAGLAKPVILLGGSHGVIDRLANYSYEMGKVSVTGIIQKTLDQVEHSIYSSPYQISEAGYGPPHSIEILNQPVIMESYPVDAVNDLRAFGILEGASRPVVGAFYSPRGLGGRIFWWAFPDPSLLNANGRHLFVNTVEWIAGITDLDLVLKYLGSVESLNPSASTFWTGGFADYFEPQIPATYYATESLKFMDKANIVNFSLLADWLVNYCYDPSGGFFKSPSRYKPSSAWSGIAETGMTLQVLYSVEALDRINLTKVSGYIKSCQASDGFVRFPGDNSKGLTNTYWAILALNLTENLCNINRSSAASYVLSCQNLNQVDKANYGGFAENPGGTSHVKETYMALACLQLLGQLSSLNRTVVEQWLMNGYSPQEGFFYEEQVFRLRQSVNLGTGYSIAGLSILGELTDIDQESVADYLTSVQFSDGGWSAANCTDEPIDEVADSYSAILGLKHLNRTTSIKDPDGFERFLLRCLCPGPTYGFSNLPNTMSNIWQTYEAIQILYELGAIDQVRAARIYDSIIDSYDTSYDRFEWIRLEYPRSPDGFASKSVDQPYEFSFVQRGKRGVILTDLAVKALLSLGKGGWIRSNSAQLWSEISQCEVVSGPYSGYYKCFSSATVSNETTGLRYTYHALSCLRNLAAFLNYSDEFPSQLPDATSTVSRIMSLYNSVTGCFIDEGYLVDPCSPAQATYMALASLQLLNALSSVDYIKTSEFLQSKLYSNLVDSYYSLKGIQILNRTSAVDSAGLLCFIRNCLRPEGVFKSGSGTPYRLETTRMAVEILRSYEHAWTSSEQIKVISSSINVPSVMKQGTTCTATLRLIDDRFGDPLSSGMVTARLGSHEFISGEIRNNNGTYALNISIPIDSRLLGHQQLILRCSDDRYQTSTTQVDVNITRADGVEYKTPTDIWITMPPDGSYLLTCNTTVAAEIRASNLSGTPIGGAQLQLYVDNLLKESSFSDLAGKVTFGWRPDSSGTYMMNITFEGTSLFDASYTEKAISVGRTPTQISIYQLGSGSISVGEMVQVGAGIVETPTGKPVAQALLHFTISDQANARSNITATTGGNGVAVIEFAADRNGTYTAYCWFQSTCYYEESASCSLSVLVNGGMADGGGNEGSDREGFSWLDDILNALATPLGSGLIASSGCLFVVSWYLRIKQRKSESLASSASQSFRPKKSSSRGRGARDENDS